jgi:Cu-processing system permease protein
MAFFFVLTFALLFLSYDLTKVIVSLNNIILVLTPLIGVLFGTMYYYSSIEFIELLLAQPISRFSVFVGMYLGLAVALVLSLVIGISIPMLFFGILFSSALGTLITLLSMSIVLTLIFSLLAFFIAIRSEDKVKGFGLAIFCWLFFALIYDGIFLLLLLIFRDYPLEKFSIALTMLNPIDLARILILLKLDVSAMMGYTGAVLQKFLGSYLGSMLIISSLTLWLVIPSWLIIRLSKRKDF